MKRSVLMIATAALLVIGSARLGSASGPFDQRLSQDQQIAQALNRLTFGPRPGDVEEVRRLLRVHSDEAFALGLIDIVEQIPSDVEVL